MNDSIYDYQQQIYDFILLSAYRISLQNSHETLYGPTSSLRVRVFIHERCATIQMALDTLWLCEMKPDNHRDARKANVVYFRLLLRKLHASTKYSCLSIA